MLILDETFLRDVEEYQIEKIDFHQRDKDQVKTYLDVLKQQ